MADRSESDRKNAAESAGSVGYLTIRANEIIIINNSLQFKERHGYQYETIYIGRAQKDMEAILY